MVLGAVAPDVVVVVIGFPSLEASLSLVMGTGFKTMGLTFSVGSVMDDIKSHMKKNYLDDFHSINVTLQCTSFRHLCYCGQRGRRSGRGKHW